jgi:hypothetical protein
MGRRRNLQKHLISIQLFVSKPLQAYPPWTPLGMIAGLPGIRLMTFLTEEEKIQFGLRATTGGRAFQT